MPGKPRPIVAHAALALLMAAPLGLIACTGTPTGVNHAAAATADIPDPIRALEARAELETLNPAEPADPQLLREINPDMRPPLVPGTPEYQRAVMDPDEIEIDDSVLGLGEGQAAEKVDGQRRAQALKLYARARTQRQNGRLEQAADTLRQAIRVDPSSPAIHRELGDTLIVSGDLVGAVRAFERGVELGDRSPRALVHIASHASTRNDHERVMALTTLALNDPAIDDHPMARAIAGTLLGNAQISAGYLRAGAQTLEEALGSFDSGSRDLRWRREIIQIIGQRSQLWVVVGDAWASVGAHGRAAEAYGRAAGGQDEPPVALIGRQIAAKLRAGQPAGAGLLLLEHMQNSVGDLGATEQRWARALCDARGMGELLSGAVAKLAQRPGLTPSIRRSLLAMEVSCLDTDDALARIASGGDETNNPAAIARVLGGIDNAEERYRAAAGLLETNPLIARAVAAALIQARTAPTRILDEHRRARSQGAQLLNTSIGLAIGRADLVGHLGSLEVEDAAERGTVWLSLHAQALALTGRWEAAGALGDELDLRADAGDADAGGELASTLLILQHPGRAWELARRLGDDVDASTGALALAGRIAQMLRRHDEAAAYLGRAHELDPYDANIAEQLVLLRGASSPAADEEELQRIVRRLGTHRPRSTLFGLMRASELARNSMVREAEALLLELNDQYPMAEVGHDLLLSIWKTQQTQGDEDALSEGIAWLGQQLETQPNSTGTAQTLARAHFELDEYERALAVLENAYTRTGSFEIARLIERLLNEQLSRPEEADAHVVGRLGGLTGVDHTIEYAAYLADRGTREAGVEMLELLGANLPGDITLLPGQVDQLSRVVLTLAESSGALDNRGVVLDTIAVIEERVPAIDFQLARVKVLLMVQGSGLDLEELIAVIDGHLEQIDDEESRQLLRAL
ncbi:MAG: tetratricopeptide repeat protein, partial [Phycisphaerales bacterium]